MRENGGELDPAKQKNPSSSGVVSNVIGNIKTMITFQIEESNYCSGRLRSAARFNKRPTDKKEPLLMRATARGNDSASAVPA